MNRPGRDNTRRNRKIGTEDQGWRKQSDFVIPDRWDMKSLAWKSYYEKLGPYIVVERKVHGRPLPIVVEPTKKGYLHPCTPTDIATLLELLPASCTFTIESIAGIVLRQPTRKQEQIEPVWGRLCYHSTVGPLEGPVIFLEAVGRGTSYSLPRRQPLAGQAELRRMEILLSNHRLEKRQHVFDLGPLELRRYVLYHTLIHEIGHWVDYLTKVVVPSTGPDHGKRLWDKYHQRPTQEKEAYAHRFSDEWRDELIRLGKIPFARQICRQAMKTEGLDPEWFSTGAPEDDAAGPALGLILPQRRTPIRP